MHERLGRPPEVCVRIVVCSHMEMIWPILVRGSQVGPLGRRSLQQLAARTALSGTNRVFDCRARYCTRPPTPRPRAADGINAPNVWLPSAVIAGIQIACRID
eukprot:COSAG03_NODE_1961_length_3293_cov_2.079524_2_plen_102_part_00